MKKQILTGIIALSTAVGALAQGTVTFDNGNANAAATQTSPNFGLIFTGPNASNTVPLGQDINLVLLGGPSAGNLSVIATYLLSDGTAALDWGFGQNPGQFADPNGNVYAVPGVALGGTAVLQVEAWLGSDTSYAAAAAHAGVSFGTSGLFNSGTGGGGSPPGAPISIGDAMPSFLVVPLAPEPTTLALCGLGAASLLLFRRKK